MQDIGKIPVEMNKTLDENYLMIKEHCNIEMYSQMMYSLLDKVIFEINIIRNRHVILEYNICTILDNGIRIYA